MGDNSMDLTKFTRTLWLHVKTQNLYRIDDMILREEDLMPCVLYHRAEDPEAPRFFRPWWEFFDGRFTQFQVEGVGGQVDDQGRPVNSVTAKKDNPKRGKQPSSVNPFEEAATAEPYAFDASSRKLYVGDWMEPAGTLPAEWGVRQPREIVEIRSNSVVIVAGDPTLVWKTTGFHKAENPMGGPSAQSKTDDDDLIPAPKRDGRPALDADEKQLKVGDWVVPLKLSSVDRRKLPVGTEPYQIKRVEEGDHPQIFFGREKDATGWYPAVFSKVESPYDTLE